MRNDFNTSITTGGETIYRSRSTPRIITQREAEHLVAVMGIIQAVAEHDEISRIMICEQANWQPPQVLLGLVGRWPHLAGHHQSGAVAQRNPIPLPNPSSKSRPPRPSRSDAAPPSNTVAPKPN